MKALLCTRYGTPDDLEMKDIPDPKAGAGEAVVRIEAAALNFFDTLIIAGKYQYKPEMPFSPAAEFSGTVEGLGTGVHSLKIGDERVIDDAVFSAVVVMVVLTTLVTPPLLMARLQRGAPKR